MTDLRSSALIREALFADPLASVHLNVATVTRETLLRDPSVTVFLRVSDVTREALLLHPISLSYLLVDGVAREALVGPPVPPAEFELLNLQVFIAKPPLQDQAFVTMRFSDDGGRHWHEKRTQPIGEIGQFHTSIQFKNLGEGRNKIFEISWSVPANTSLGGGTIETKIAGS